MTSTSDAADICSVQGHQSALIGDRLYFISGEYKTVGPSGNVSDSQSNPSLSWLDLSSTFRVETLLSSDYVHKTSIPSHITAHIGFQTSAAYSTALFATNDSFYLYGGTSSDIKADHVLASYNRTIDAWKPVSISGGNLQDYGSTHGTSISIPTSGLSFSIRGVDGKLGLLKFNASDPSEPSWTFRPLESQYQPRNISMWDLDLGRIAYLPVGKAGVFLFLGGANATSGWEREPLSMETISVYDIDTSAWYSVQATGTPDVPHGRSYFCLGVSRAPDDSSFQITLYGGVYGDRIYLEDIWVLSVPSFRWISVQDTDNKERSDNGPGAGRYGHRCTMWQDSQMIVLGGIYASTAAVPAPGPENKSFCRSTYSPIRLLDTSTYSWKTQYTSENTYSIPSAVSDVIGGDYSGKSNLKRPIGGWSDPILERIFSQTLPRVNGPPSKSNNPPATQPSSSPGNGSSSTGTTPPATIPSSGSPPAPNKPAISIGGIAGGVAAAAAFCLVAIAAIWWLAKRKRKRKRAPRDDGHMNRKSYRKPELEDTPIRLLDPRLQQVHELPSNVIYEASA